MVSSYNDLFVATVAIAGAVGALVVAIGPWENPYRLRTIASVVDRFGMSAARWVWVAIAIISLVAGVAIATGVRPGYAKPTQGLMDNAR